MKFCISVVVLFLFFPSFAPAENKSAVLTALEKELKRSYRILKEKGDTPPYFLSYEVTEIKGIEISANFGALDRTSRRNTRLLDIDLRVGGYDFDNTHQIRGRSNVARSGSFPSIGLPLEDDVDALRSSIWIETDKRYRSAIERFMQIKGNRAVKVQEEDRSADFSRETPQVSVRAVETLQVDAADLEQTAKRYSAYFKNFPDIYYSEVRISYNVTNKYQINTEGTILQHGQKHARLVIVATTRAEDGMDLYRHETFDARTIAELPDEERIQKALAKIANDLNALREAPVIEPYTGPAILSGRASGVFFHEIFGHRIEGHRQKDEEQGQTFTKKINEPVLPEFLSVYDDPTLRELNGIDLNGYYEFDDEGVKAQQVVVVENGVLKNFLMSRSPVAGFEKSNGHGRKSPGRRAVGRQGNLIMKSSKPVSRDELRKMLIELCKEQNQPFGLLFEDISGGFTFTDRGSPQAFQVTPIMVYRIYTDGRPDELVRGVDLIGTPLTSFSKVIATGNEQEIFNGICGAESGWVKVSAVSPAILTSQIEVQKRAKSSERLPILPPPGSRN